MPGDLGKNGKYSYGLVLLVKSLIKEKNLSLCLR